MKPCITIIFLLILSSFNFGQEKTELLDSLFRTMHERGQFNGNILIAENDKISFSKSYGFSDIEMELSLNSETLFNIGSVSKAFTAIAILQLEESGKLNIKDKVTAYITEFPYPEISIHMWDYM